MDTQDKLGRMRLEAEMLVAKITEHDRQIAYARRHGTDYDPDPELKDTRDRLLFLRARIGRLDQVPAR